MNFQSENWKTEAHAKTFVSKSLEDSLVKETVRRIGMLIDIHGKGRTLTEIISIAVFDAQELQCKRANHDEGS